MITVVDLWIYLSGGPLLWLTATLVAYAIAERASHALGRHPLAHPVPLAIAMVSALLAATGTSFPTYFAGAQFVHFLLGPATVALAVPLFRQWPLVRRSILPMAVALLVGGVVAIVSAVGLALLLGLPEQIALALAPKSVTAAIAMGVADTIGADPALAAVLVITTGILGAIMAKPVLDLAGVRHRAARGFAIGLSAHGIGTARAFQDNEVAGTFAGIAMGLNGLITAMLVPLLVLLLR
ncbi:LrgB family protein [Blastochloris viridis]|uniref:LrgB family protein n=1 Tax=Blastochloris viridis TaxID=1079 RepID=UPI0006D74A73|nr:LrgB family protein [Blastochloris viridis]ALK08874.1 Inner membrane protein YohK [Blastochloris viridis]